MIYQPNVNDLVTYRLEISAVHHPPSLLFKQTPAFMILVFYALIAPTIKQIKQVWKHKLPLVHFPKESCSNCSVQSYCSTENRHHSGHH